MSEYGIKSSFPGKDVFSDKTKDLSIDTSLSCFKVQVGHYDLVTQTVNIDEDPSGPGTLTLLTIPHGYKFVPCVTGMVNLNFHSMVNDDWSQVPLQFEGYNTIALDADATNVYLRVYYNQFGMSPFSLHGIVKVKYYIWAHQGA